METEKASIDEVFIDLSSPVRDRIIERYPHLKTVPENAPFGSNTPLPQPLIISWKDNVHGYLMSVDGVDESESGLDEGRDSPPTWHDVALSIGAEIVDDIRARVRDDLRYTTSAGIARNKAMAKLVASYKKPNSQVLFVLLQ
jgi:DNA polymerase eta